MVSKKQPILSLIQQRLLLLSHTHAMSGWTITRSYLSLEPSALACWCRITLGRGHCLSFDMSQREVWRWWLSVSVEILLVAELFGTWWFQTWGSIIIRSWEHWLGLSDILRHWIVTGMLGRPLQMTLSPLLVLFLPSLTILIVLPYLPLILPFLPLLRSMVRLILFLPLPMLSSIT